MTAAIEALYPDVLQTIGPAIEDGFYHDYDFGEQKVSDEVFPKIEKKMAELVKDWKGFTHKEVSKEEALKVFKNNKYKQELIEEFSKNGEKITLYTAGGFVDLCEGGHSEHPDKEIKYFKLLSIAGSYWRGSEKNKMLTRIYGTVFPTQKELDDYLMQLELAKLHDHRKLGKELELFAISEEVGPGLILWLPKGNIIKDEIEDWAKKTEKEWGYQRVTTPNITKSGLYFTSGHLPYYKDDMYPAMKLDGGEEYYLKPMNCPHHHMIFKSIPRSYKELPLRLAEYGTCYRYEASGELFGMLRVRGFTQNDSHIYCTQDQAVDEFVNVMKLHEYYYKSLGITDYHLELSLRDPKNKKKYHGNEEMWKLAEKLMRKAVAKLDIKMVEQVGSAAFYGPKIDFIIKSSTGREFGISTNQIDLFMGERFGLKYVDKDGSEKTPVIIHRAPLGSHERFIGFLIEHFGGNFPTWLTPVQVKVLPITDRNLDYAKRIAKILVDNNIRVEVDERNETLGAKIRNAQNEKVAYMLIVGDKEEKADSVSERGRSGKDYGSQPLETFVENIKKEISEKSIN
jgi:threonyl-tRNA synthetase